MLSTWFLISDIIALCRKVTRGDGEVNSPYVDDIQPTGWNLSNIMSSKIHSSQRLVLVLLKIKFIIYYMVLDKHAPKFLQATQTQVSME